MNWSKIKTILIIALFSTNLFLAWNIISAKMIPTDLDRQSISETLDVLAENEIYVECNVPPEYPSMPVLFVSYDEHNGTFTYLDTSNQTQKIPFSAKEAQDIAKRFLIQKNLFTDNVFFFHTIPLSKEENGYMVTFKGFINDIQMQDCYITCKVINGNVTQLERFWINPEAFGNSKGRIIPATAALLRLINNETVLKPMTITDIDLVYYLDSSFTKTAETATDTARPAWRIITKEKQELFIPAFAQ